MDDTASPAARPPGARLPSTPRRARWRLRRRHLFPVFGSVLLAAVWGLTVFVSHLERASAERIAVSATTELTQTYEAQVSRALGDIDKALNVVKYGYERGDGAAALDTLSARGLLPPDLLFDIGIVGADARPVATRRGDPSQLSLSSADFDQLRRSGKLSAALSARPGHPGEWLLTFGCVLDDAQGNFAGAVLLSVDASYFVSSYEPERLGSEGALALTGDDGGIRVRRVGELVRSGQRGPAGTAAASRAADGQKAALLVDPLDGIARFQAARRLDAYGLTVTVGISETEAMRVANRQVGLYVLAATVVSVLMIVVLRILARMSRDLAVARKREVASALEHARHVERLAYHDALTGLPNRSLFSKLLEHGMHQAERQGRQLAVLFLDLDRFKQINDTLGHEAGDALLKEVAHRLQASVRACDTVARLGGDEFVVVLPGICSSQDAATVAQKMLMAVAEPFDLIGHQVSVTTSIGIGVYPDDGEDEDMLKKNADVAMYQAKAMGKNNFQFYSESLNANSLQRLSLEASLRMAVERGEFELHYQAKKDLQTGQVAGLEALLRWRHPNLGLVSPMQFIPLAEEMGLTPRIGRWVLATACRQNMQWQRQGLAPVRISVNLTARQFNDDRLIDDINAALRESGMDAGLLELEVKEGVLMQDIDKSVRILNAFKANAIRVAIDDFGLGYASISAIQRFPVDTLKIDRSFMRDITDSERGQELTAAIIQMGKLLSLTVVAQGVENEQQAELLQLQSCNELAGYYFHQPVPAELCQALLHAPAPKPGQPRAVETDLA